MFPIQYADIIVPLPLGDTFTYGIPPQMEADIQVGMRVTVQFGQRKFYSGIVYRIHTEKPSDEFELKYIYSLLDSHPIVCKQQLELWEWMTSYYCCTIGEIYKAAIPSGLKLESETKFCYNPDFIAEEKLNETEQQILLLLKAEGLSNLKAINKSVKQKAVLNALSKLLKKKAVLVEERLRNNYKPKTKPVVQLHPSINNQQTMDEALASLDRAKKQQQLFLHITELAYGSPEPIDKKELLSQSNTSDSALKELVKKELVVVEQLAIDRLESNPDAEEHIHTLSDAQHQAFEEIKAYGSSKPVLLHGVTSSGKTEIYIKLIEEQLRLGKQVLYLVPEIGISTQLIRRLKTAFGDKAGVYHSRFSDGERVEIWNKTLDQEEQNFQVVVGARSAVLLPFSNLGLIIVDEEHEQSFKQFDPSPRYHARDVAVVLAHIHKANILLGSATPAFETFFNAKSGKYGYVQLNQRFKNVSLPEIIIANQKEATRKKEMYSLLTPELYAATEEALAKNEQIIIFQNRRGYSPYIQCGQCGWIPKCKNCDVSLTYHKRLNYLNCHYCGLGMNYPDACPDCGHQDIRTQGFGTEKIEEELGLLFPNAAVARMDLDSTRSKHGYERIIADFEAHRVDILVGTQMVSKGLDFEHVSVVGVLNADQLINYPDFRTYERAFQMLTQVSGRAGRRNKKGRVVIQTSQPDHEVIEMVKKGDFTELFKQSLVERKLFRYPPYYRLVKVVMKHRILETLNPAAQALADQLRKHFALNVLGPEFPLVSRIQSLYQKEIWVKLPRDSALNEQKKIISNYTQQLKKMKNNSSLVIYLDVDPM